MAPALTDSLLSWYAEHGRDLPWRQARDPYAIWVSEVMLQQTRVETVLPYYERWMVRFPTVEDLAAAPIEEVLALWEGLGYYRRAHQLHRAARLVVQEHGGDLPHDPQVLQGLPGIGRYSAAAVAAFAFHADVVALDGNLRRVLARLFDLEVDPRSPHGERRLVEQAMSILPPGRAADFNQALMDLGTAVCTPRAPACGSCPLEASCLAVQRGTQDHRPVRAPRRSVPHRTAVAAVLFRNGKVLIGRRAEDKLLGGLWEFPSGKVEAGEGLEGSLRREIQEALSVEIEVREPLGVFQHAYTHFRVTLHTFKCRLIAGEPQPIEHTQIRWVQVDRLGDFPMGKLDREIARVVGAG